MSAILNKLPSILAFLVGAMSIIAGGMVMRGWRPGYSVLSWLPIYNFVMGFLALIPAVLLWINSRHAMIAAIGTFGIHALVLLVLFTAFHDKVANQSLAAMAFRLATWTVILMLMFFQTRKGI